MHLPQPAPRLSFVLAFALVCLAPCPNPALGQRKVEAPQPQTHALHLQFSGEQPRPLAMASGDFDEDGFADLVVGYGTKNGGSITLLRGNPDAIGARSQAGWIAAGRHEFLPSFLQDSKPLALKTAPGLMTSADVNGDGHLDLVYTPSDGSRLYVMFGTGKGAFLPRMASIAVPGTITALSSYRPGMPALGDVLTVGWESKRGDGISIVSFGAQGLSIEATYKLPGKPTVFAVGQLDSDFIPDTAIVAGGELLVLHGRNAIHGNGFLESLGVSGVESVAAGSFFFDRHLLPQLSVLTSNGEVVFLAHRGFDPRPYTPEQIASQRRSHERGANAPTLGQQAGDNGSAPWAEIERHSGRELGFSGAAAPVMLRSRMSGSGGDDLVVLNPSRQQRITISHGLLPAHTPEAALDRSRPYPFSPSRVSVGSIGSSAIVAALSMRVNSDGRQGLVILNAGDPSPEITVPSAGNTFYVNTFADNTGTTIDPSDTVRCSNGGGEQCTLRDAITYANEDGTVNISLGTSDTIMLPAGTYPLTFQQGSMDKNSNLLTHLEILGPVTIIGSTSGGGTIINAQQNDTVFSINPGPYGSYDPNFVSYIFDATLENLTIENGKNNNNLANNAKANDVGGAINWDAYGSGNLTLSYVTVTNNSVQWGPGGGVWGYNSAGGGSGALTITGNIISNNSASEQGGGIYIAYPPAALSITNSTISGNEASVNVNLSDSGGSDGEDQGGGIYLTERPSGSGTSASSISGSIIDTNTANGAGGGIASYTGLTLTTSVLSGNSSTFASPTGESGNADAYEGGGLYSEIASPEIAPTVTSTNFLSNSAYSSGGGIAVGNETAADGNGLQISLSRIYGNTSTNGVNGLASGEPAASGSGDVTAIDNWWGCNTGPTTNGDGCDQAAQVGSSDLGTLTVSPWAEFLLSATTATTIPIGNNIGLSVTLNTDSSSEAIAGAFPAVTNSGYTYSFALSGITGNSIPNGTFSTAGTGSATLTPTSTGAGTISATFDGQTDAIALTVDQPAALSSPAPGSTLTGSSQTFSWTTGIGVTTYWLYLGTNGAGSANLYSSGPLKSTSIGVTGLPTVGVTIYATLFSSINGAWVPEYYTYTEFGSYTLAAMTSPAPGSTLTGTSATFMWSPGAGPAAYWLYLGTTGPKSANLYNSGLTTANSLTVNGLPANGVTIYATLFSEIDGAWQPVSYTYTESGTYTLAAMTSPVQGSTLPGSTVTFTWSAGAGPTMYYLYLGTTGANSFDVYKSGNQFGTSLMVSGIPTNGGELFVTLFSNIDGAWQAAHYTYVESGTAVPAAMTSPSPGSTFSGSSATFNWTTGSGVTAYWLYVGTTGPKSANLLNSGSISGTSLIVNGLPTNGVTVYVTLFSEIDGVWQPASYTYTESGSYSLAAMISPTPGTTLPGTSTTFTWSASAGGTGYWLYLGSTGPKSANLYSSGNLSVTSIPVNGLPTNGETIYATLFTLIDGVWQPVSYTYTAQ